MSPSQPPPAGPDRAQRSAASSEAERRWQRAAALATTGFVLWFVGALVAHVRLTDGWECVSEPWRSFATFGAGVLGVVPLAAGFALWNKRAVERLPLADQRQRDQVALGLVNSLWLLAAGGVSAQVLDFTRATPPARVSGQVVEPRLLRGEGRTPDRFFLVVTDLGGADGLLWIPVPQALHDRARPFDTLWLQVRRGLLFGRVFARQPELEPQPPAPAPAPAPAPVLPEAENAGR